jgi:hypothetical protein
LFIHDNVFAISDFIFKNDFILGKLIHLFEKFGMVADEKIGRI